MRQYIKRIITAALAFALALTAPNAAYCASAASYDTPAECHGKLSVRGTDIVDQYGAKFQMRGVSTHGINWDTGRPYVTKEAFRSLRDDWGVNAVRLSMYTAEYNGYCSGGDQTALKKLVSDGVTYATELGMYVIIDWHILFDNNPLTNKEAAKAFFGEMSEKYKDNVNVIYEICNEPNNCTWEDIKKYANEVIPVIRANDPDAIILVGTPTWSQLGAQGHTNEVADSPLTGCSNIMYVLHFYAAESGHSQYLPDKVRYAMKKGLPVFVSEFGLSEASGHGRLDFDMGKTWLDLLDSYNISYFCWSLTNADATSALLKAGTAKKSGWTDSDLSESGKWIKAQYLARAELPAEIVFTDTYGKWMDEAALYLNERGIVSGIGGKLFAPERKVTRAEFLTMLMRAVGAEPDGWQTTPQFRDVPSGVYYYDYALKARALGIIEGTGGNSFNPDANITRQDMFTMLHRAMEAAGMYAGNGGGTAAFTDWDSVAGYARGPVSAIASLGLVSGKGGGLLDPKGTATRAESAQLVYNMLAAS